MSLDGKHFYRFTYLKSEEWKTARLIALARAGGRCALCGKVDWHNDAHHRKYPEDIWDTGPHHLVILCRSCHDKVHQKFGKEASKRKWRSVRTAIQIQDRIEYEKENPTEPRCVFCQSELGLRTLKNWKTGTFWICKDCDIVFGKHEKRCLSFWRAFDATKAELKEFRIAVLQAAKRYFAKTQKANRKILRILAKERDFLYS